MNDTLTVPGDAVREHDEIFIQGDWYNVKSAQTIDSLTTRLILARKGQWTCKCEIFNTSRYTIKARNF